MPTPGQLVTWQAEAERLTATTTAQVRACQEVLGRAQRALEMARAEWERAIAEEAALEKWVKLLARRQSNSEEPKATR